MAPKKKAAAAGDGPDPFEEFKKKYQKLLKEHEGTPKIKEVEMICDKIASGEEDGSTSSWVLTEPFDPMAFRLIKMLRMWTCGQPGDEAVRAVCFYLDSPCQFAD